MQEEELLISAIHLHADGFFGSTEELVDGNEEEGRRKMDKICKI